MTATEAAIDTAIQRAIHSLRGKTLPARVENHRFFIGLARAVSGLLFHVDQLSAPTDTSRHSFAGELAILSGTNPAAATPLRERVQAGVEGSALELKVRLSVGESAGVLAPANVRRLLPLISSAVTIASGVAPRPIRSLTEMAALRSELQQAAMDLLSPEGSVPPPVLPPSAGEASQIAREGARFRGGEGGALSGRVDSERVDLQTHERAALLASAVVPSSEKVPFFAEFAYLTGEFLARASLVVPPPPSGGRTWAGSILDLFALDKVSACFRIDETQSELRLAGVSLIAQTIRGEVSGFFAPQTARLFAGGVLAIMQSAECLKVQPKAAMQRIAGALPKVRDRAAELLLIAPVPTAPNESQESIDVVGPAATPVTPTSVQSPRPLSRVEETEEATVSSPFEDAGSPAERAHGLRAADVQSTQPAQGTSGVHEYLRDGFGFERATVEAIEARLRSHAVSDDLLLQIEQKLKAVPAPIVRGLVRHNPKLFPTTCEAADEITVRYQAVLDVYTRKQVPQSDAAIMLEAAPLLLLRDASFHRAHADTLRQLRRTLQCGSAPITEFGLSGEQIGPSQIKATLRQERGRLKVAPT